MLIMTRLKFPLYFSVLFVVVFTQQTISSAASEPNAMQKQPDSVNQFADKLILATDKERQILLDANQQLINQDLVRTLLVRGVEARQQQDFPKALFVFSIAKTIAERLPSGTLVRETLTEAGITNIDADTVPEGLKLLDIAYKQATSASDMRLRSRIDTARAQAYLKTGELGSALDAAKRAVNTAPMNDAITTGDAHTLLGRALAALALYKQAFPEFEKAIEAYAVPNKSKAVPVLNEEAILYSDTGEKEEAVATYDKLLLMLGPASDENRYRRIILLINKGLDQALSGHPVEGLETINAAIPLIKATDTDVTRASAQLNRALAAHLANDLPQAFEAIKLAYKYSTDSTESEAKRPLNTIRIEWSRFLSSKPNATPEDIQQAIALAEEAVRATDPDDLDAKQQAQVAAGNAYLAGKRPDQALASLISATEVIDQLVSNLGDDPEAIASYLADKTDIYEGASRLLAETGKPIDGLLLLEHARARGLLSVISRGVPLPRTRMSNADREREAVLKAKLAQANAAVKESSQNAALEDSARRQIQAALQEARRDWGSLRLLLNRKYPGIYQVSRQVLPLNAAGLRSLLSRDTAILEYILNDVDALGFVIVRSPSGTPEVHTFKLKGQPAIIEQKIERYKQLVSNENGIYESAGKDLYQTLVAEAEPFIAAKHRLIIVPTSQLWEVPFQALVMPTGEFFIQRHAVSYVASLSILSDMRRLPPFSAAARRQLITFANPQVSVNPAGASKPYINRQQNTPLMDQPLAPLDNIEQQAKALGRQLGRIHFVYTSTRATETRFRKEAPTATALYFAAHSIVNNESPLYSRIVLTGRGNNTDSDGVVEAWEVLEMRIPASIAILAACETAGGKIKTGEGMIGLSWAFSIAGTPRLIASQWSVPESSTTKLMDVMMRRMFGISSAGYLSRRGRPPDLALQDAAKVLIEDNMTKHPWHWAAFQVIGDAR